MSQKLSDESIILKQYISEKDYNDLTNLEKICYEYDKINLKLELDYKLNSNTENEIILGLKEINEFFYYIDKELVAYIGISSFGGTKIAEINGMTHPKHRSKGLFKKLFESVMTECKKRDFTKLLLLTDGKSNLGISFIQSVNGIYDFSEYRMKCTTALDSYISPVKLRKATNKDSKEIAKQNAKYFNDSDEYEILPEKEEEYGYVTYMIELNEVIIGKIVISCDSNHAFISGFGVVPDYRGKGYGKAALLTALHLINKKDIYNIELDVECKNNNALNLYKSCGFEEKSIMNYYSF